MINILIPLAGKSIFFENSSFHYPKPIIEIGNKPMIELVIQNFCKSFSEKINFIFLVRDEDITKFHIDNTIKLLMPTAKIITVKKDTRGAACTALLAIEEINNQEELIIANGDQIIEINFQQVVESFRKSKSDAGVISFESVHPKWSYLLLENDRIVETAEKRPISKNAIAGFYYFKTGSDFVESAFLSIKNNCEHEGSYFIAPTLNQLILRNKIVSHFPIAKDSYHSFSSPKKIEEYESEYLRS